MASHRNFQPIERWVLGQATYNQPYAAIAAHEQFLEQNAAGDGRLVVIDSSPVANAATAHFENAVQEDPRILYFHIPYRPGYENSFNLDTETYPLAYRWITGPKYNALYEATIPHDEVLRQAYIHQQDIRSTLAVYHPAAFEDIVGHREYHEVNHDAWASAVHEFASRGGFHERPHLGSKRNLIHAIAMEMGAQAIINYDDDKLGNGYVQSQLDALKQAHFTGKMQYMTVVYTACMIENGTPPIWGITDLNASGGYFLDYCGEKVDGDVRPQPSMGWTQARRIGSGLPEVPHILGGEDRATEQRFRDQGLVVNVQNEFCREAIRLVYGASTSLNLVTREVELNDVRVPPESARNDIIEFMMRLQGGGCQDMASDRDGPSRVYDGQKRDVEPARLVLQ